VSLHAGIEIDGSQVRVTVIDGSPKKYRVVDFVEGRITGETEDERRDSLRELLAPVLLGKDRRGLDVGISLGADRAILREINVPFTKDDVIAKTIRFESESHIHAHSVEDLLIEYIKTSESESGCSRCRSTPRGPS
jgi:Tfp pilus assembly PilM family ATPase